eukprot:TRINITY_DN2109_c0_g1_i1.p1 TRINITY_DN2109_c0_g1~~TRINITY_DN2109_c0_g1_i1.p1  ORF type:complete len:1418 (-),score=299.30 TRINITY_DN2109_c0_g1_i1:29-4282(-)
MSSSSRKKGNKKELFVIDQRVHGQGPLVFSWHPDGTYLASSGANKLVNIFDRSGTSVSTVSLSGICLAMEWDKDGEILAIIQSIGSAVILWDKNTMKSQTVDTGMKEALTFIKWSITGPNLAIGSSRGNLVIYNKRTSRKSTFPNKHPKAIICGAWNSDGLLALGCEGQQLTISSSEGENIESTVLKTKPYNLVFAEIKTNQKGGIGKGDNTISIDLGHKTVYLYNLEDRENPIELAFQPKYGNISTYKWFGDGYIMIGFSAGFFVVISTHKREVEQELFSSKMFNGEVTDIVYCPSIHKVAVCGDNTIRVVETTDWKNYTDTFVIEDSMNTLNGYAVIAKLEWTSDGHILSAATHSGSLHNFLTKLPSIHAAYGARCATLSSLQQVVVVDSQRQSLGFAPIDLEIEPTFLALGPDHLAAGVNNHIWFYRISHSGSHSSMVTATPRKGGPPPQVSIVVGERDYLGTVQNIQINHLYAAVLAEGVAQLHLIEGKGEDSKLFPEKEKLQEGKEEARQNRGSKKVASGGAVPQVQCIALTTEHFIYGTSHGTLFYYLLDEKVIVNEYRHSSGIRLVYPNISGTRVVFIDSNHDGFLYNPVNDVLIKIEGISPHTSMIIWDQIDWGVFVICESDNSALTCYAYIPTTHSGPQVRKVGTTALPPKHTPILLQNGIVTCQEDSNGSIKNVVLTSHDGLVQSGSTISSQDREKQKTLFTQSLALNRIKECWELALRVKEKSIFVTLGQEAMKQLDIELAIGCYRHAADPGMVMSLQRIQPIEEKTLLAAHVCLLSGDYESAQRLFLSSTRPMGALEMRRDLLHWEQALNLAKSLSPDQIPVLSREYAQQLEFKGEYQPALDMYQKSLSGFPANSLQAKLALSGVVRTTFRLGDTATAMNLVNNAKNVQLFRECAAILESMKQFQEAAQLYEKGGLYDKAAGIYIKTKNYNMAGALMAKVTAPRIHQEYAQVKEEQGQYQEAERAYILAKDVDNVIRLNLDHLKSPEKAFALVRDTRTPGGARLAARFCQQNRDFASAIEFLLLAKIPEEAFSLARQYDQMTRFAEILGDKGTMDQYIEIAQHFENTGDLLNAARYYAVCGQYGRSLKFYMQIGSDTSLAPELQNTAIEQAIDMIGKAQNESLTHQLLEYLRGSVDGIPKDTNHIFRLHLALGNYEEAARHAVVIARSEQELGNYKLAHRILLDTYLQLESHGIKVPYELRRTMVILHSYILAKVFVKNKMHKKAANVLLRVSRNISRFPSHVVPILTLTVVECDKAGMKKSAFEHAVTLMRPEYRHQIDAAYKRKIENMVRKPDKSQLEEKASPCPSCKYLLFKTELDCPSCKESLPCCIASGRHMTLDNWSNCPNCKFPALYSSFVKLLNFEKACPMCEHPLEASDITKEINSFQLFKKAIDSVESNSNSMNQ